MRYAVLIESIQEPGFEGFYYAHIPTLDLTTQGKGIEGALAAASELAEAWVAERRAHNGPVPIETTTLVGHVEVPDAVLGA